jgi:hypothetical protein
MRRSGLSTHDGWHEVPVCARVCMCVCARVGVCAYVRGCVCECAFVHPFPLPGPSPPRGNTCRARCKRSTRSTSGLGPCRCSSPRTRWWARSSHRRTRRLWRPDSPLTLSCRCGISRWGPTVAAFPALPSLDPGPCPLSPAPCPLRHTHAIASSLCRCAPLTLGARTPGIHTRRFLVCLTPFVPLTGACGPRPVDPP